MSNKIALRKKTRQLLLQALYSWEISRTEISEIQTHLLTENNPAKLDVTYFNELLEGIVRCYPELENAFSPFLSRPLGDLDPIEKCILWLSSYELIHRLDVPYKVAINEGLELAKEFGGTDGHKFINGVLDQLAMQARATEYRVPKK